jgi:hypothetical protein
VVRDSSKRNSKQGVEIGTKIYSNKEEMNNKDKNIAYKKIARFIDQGFHSKF